MQAKDLVQFVGLQSTFPEMESFFEKNELGKPPKTVNANQGRKGASDKKRGISYFFGFDIKNDLYYPPVCAKSDNYTFYCYLQNIALFSRTNKKAKVSEDFWEDFFHPESTYEDFKTYFSVEDGVRFAQKKLNDICVLKAWFDTNKNEVTSIEMGILEHWELLSQHDFNEDNEYNRMKHADALIVKWLFDQCYLVLSEDVYAKGLGYGLEEIRDFVQQNLKNHVWDNQLNQDRDLGLFISKISSNSSYMQQNGERVNIYFNHQYIKEAGLWDEYQKIEDHNDRDEFEENILLTENQSRELLNSLSKVYHTFRTTKKSI